MVERALKWWRCWQIIRQRRENDDDQSEDRKRKKRTYGLDFGIGLGFAQGAGSAVEVVGELAKGVEWRVQVLNVAGLGRVRLEAFRGFTLFLTCKEGFKKLK